MPRNIIDRVVEADVQGELRLPPDFWQLDVAAREAKAAELLGIPLALDDSPPRIPAGVKPRVMLYSHALGMGGAERWLVGLAQTLDRTCVNLIGAGILSVEGGDSILLAKLSEATPLHVGRDACRKLAEAVDVIVFWAEPLPPFPLPRHCIWCSHGSGHWSWPVARGAEAAGHHLAAVSAEAARAFPTPSKARIIFNGMDASRLAVEVGRDATRESWGVAADEVLLGYVGRFWSDKRPEGAAEAAQFLGGKYRAVCVGSGNPPWVDFLQRFGPRTIMAGRLEMLGDAYAALDALVMASEAEGFSMSVTEAWYCGCPVVTTAVGVVPELEAIHGQLTWTVPPHAHVEAFAEAVKKVSRDDPRVKRARNLAASTFTYADMGRRWTDYILEVCGG